MSQLILDGVLQPEYTNPALLDFDYLSALSPRDDMLDEIIINDVSTGLIKKMALTDLLAGLATDEKVKVSSNDTIAKYLENSITVNAGVNAANILELTTLNDGADEDLQLQIDITKINHDLLYGFVGNEHIDWTNTSSNFKTYGEARVKYLGINTNVDDYNLGIKLFKEIGSGNIGAHIYGRCVMSGDDTEFYGLWNKLEYPLAGNEYGVMKGVFNDLSAGQDGVTMIGIDNQLDNDVVDGITYGLRQIFGAGSDGSFQAPIYQEFDASGSGQTVNGLRNVGICGNDSAEISGIKNDFTINAYGGNGFGMKNTFSVREEDDNGWGTWNYIYGHASAQDYIILCGTYNQIVPNKDDMEAYGTYTKSWYSPFSKPTINNPSAYQCGIYLDWHISGTDTGMKKWALYNSGTVEESSKIFLGKDDIPTIWGTLFNATILHDGSDFIFNSRAVGSGDFKMNGGYMYINVRSGATQGAAGASAKEIWKTASHATLPDNVLMIGV